MAKNSKSKNPDKPPPLLPPLPIRIYRLHAKLAIAAVVGLVIAAASIAFDMRVLARILAGWDVGVAVYLVLTYLMMWRADVEQIRRRASAQDEGAHAILLLSIAATFASLVAIVLALVGSKQSDAGIAVGLAIVTIVLSWAFVHTIFSFHYAHEYYGERRDGKIGGLVFPSDDKPDYRDFLYFSLVIGMTSQVSDVVITSKVIRRMAALHGVLSFFFNLVVLALTVNVVANLI
jgi:uncharacterized membrane protein